MAMDSHETIKFLRRDNMYLLSALDKLVQVIDTGIVGIGNDITQFPMQPAAIPGVPGAGTNNKLHVVRLTKCHPLYPKASVSGEDNHVKTISMCGNGCGCGAGENQRKRKAHRITTSPVVASSTLCDQSTINIQPPPAPHSQLLAAQPAPMSISMTAMIAEREKYMEQTARLCAMQQRFHALSVQQEQVKRMLRGAQQDDPYSSPYTEEEVRKMMVMYDSVTMLMDMLKDAMLRCKRKLSYLAKKYKGHAAEGV